MGGTSRTGTHMSAVDCKYLSFTGVGYTDLDYVNLGATRSGAKGAGADIEAGQTGRNGQRRADASIHLPPIPGPARMPLMGEGETMQGLMSALEQRRLDALKEKDDVRNKDSMTDFYSNMLKGTNKASGAIVRGGT